MPEVMVAQMIAMITEEDDDRVVAQARLIEGVDDPPHLRIHEARGGGGMPGLHP